MKFRCAACGHSFLVVRADGSVPDRAVAPPSRGYRVDDNGETIEAPDLAALQRLVVEERIGPAARVTPPGGAPIAASSLPELAVFFDLVARASFQPAAAPAPPETAPAPEAAPALEPEPAVATPADAAVAAAVPSAFARALNERPEPSTAEILRWDDDEPEADGAAQALEPAPAPEPTLELSPSSGQRVLPQTPADDLSWLDVGEPAVDDDSAWLDMDAGSAGAAPAGGPNEPALEEPASAPPGEEPGDSGVVAADERGLVGGDVADAGAAPAASSESTGGSDLSWLSALSASSAAADLPTVAAPVGPAASAGADSAPAPSEPAGVSWLEQADAPADGTADAAPSWLDSLGDGGEGSGGGTDLAWLDAPDLGEASGAGGDNDLSWLEDPALDGASDGKPVSAFASSARPAQQKQPNGVPDDVLALAAKLSVPAMDTRNSDAGDADGGRALPDAPALWGTASDFDHLAAVDAATEQIDPFSAVRLGDEDVTEEVPAGAFATTLDADLSDLDGVQANDGSYSQDGGTGRLFMLVLLLLAAGGVAWWVWQSSAANQDTTETNVATATAGPSSAAKGAEKPKGTTAPAPTAGSQAASGAASPAEAGSPDGTAKEPGATQAAAAGSAAAGAPASGAAASSKSAAGESAATKGAAPKSAATKSAASKKKRTTSSGGRKAVTSRGVKALVTRGWKQVDQGKLGDAKATFGKAISTKSTSGDAHFGAGYVAELNGDLSNAYREYCLARYHEPDSVNLQREVAGRLRAIGRSCD
jgi:hypothetical protein